MSGHTEGAWVFAGPLGYGWLIAPQIAVVYGGEHGRANAQLIAAAPTLLQALKEGLPFLARAPGRNKADLAYAGAVAAIKKAEGDWK